MTLQTLNEQLLALRLPAFRQALQEQQANPKYTELSFEDRLALLVDQECTQRRENRIRRNIQAAVFSMSASLEDLDISAARGLERRSILELGQCNWVTARQNIIILGPTCSGKSFLACAFGTAAARNGFTVRYHRTSRLLHTLTRRAKMARGRDGCAPWPAPACSYWMTGCATPSRFKTHRISWRFSMIGSDIQPP